jgi:hypothetical protein
MRNLLASKSTIGMLLKELKDSVRAEDPEAFVKYLLTVATHRNELVHHFFQLPIGGLSDERGCREALEHLNSTQIRDFICAANAFRRALIG